MDEKYLPRISKAAVNIYNAIMYVHERLDINKAKVNNADIARLTAALDKAGLYNIFLGAFLVKEAHLIHLNNSSSDDGGANSQNTKSNNKNTVSNISKTREAHAFTSKLNPIIERIAREKIMSKLSRAKISASSRDE